MQTLSLPRERAKEHGLEYLSLYEILALILRTGGQKHDVLACARKIIQQYSDINDFKKANIQKLCEIAGIGESKAFSILAALELGKRLHQNQYVEPFSQIRKPEDCYHYFCQKLETIPQETFFTIFLNAKNHIIGHCEIYRGGLTSIQIHPREIFRPAIENSACSIILLHNHPSGDPSPSDADILATAELIETGKMIGIPILDHIIIGYQTYISMKQENII